IPSETARGGTCDPCCRDISENADPATCMASIAKTACGEGASITGCQNGCGPDGSAGEFVKAINDAFTDAELTPICNAHDNCYNTCGSSRDACDQQFRDGVLAACDARYGDRNAGVALGICKALVWHEFAIVHTFTPMSSAWGSDQRNNCK